LIENYLCSDTMSDASHASPRVIGEHAKSIRHNCELMTNIITYFHYRYYWYFYDFIC